MRPDPDKVRIWEARAPAYDRLIRNYEIFSLLSNRLIDLLPPDLHGPVLDIGAGSGLTSEILLDRHPQCQAILVDPSPAMLNIARRNLAGRPARFLVGGLDSDAVRDVRAVAAIASAAMHFVDLDSAFATLAGIVEPRGHLAFNIWWHSWEETADSKCMAGSRSVVEAVCLDAQHSPPPAPVPGKAKTRTELTSASRQHGFRLLTEHRDEFLVPVAFGVDFGAMDDDWPVKECGPEVRAALLAKMHELARGQSETLISMRFLFQRMGTER